MKKETDTTLGDWLDVYTNPEFIDNELSEKGIQQCLEAAKHAKDINFKTIFISPMRRTLQTAYYIFKDHANFKNKSMRLIVNPDIREKLHVACDIPTENIGTLINEFEDKMNHQIDILKMSHLLDNGEWYLESMDKESQNFIKQEQKKLGFSLQDTCLQMIENIYPQAPESINSVYERTLRVKKDLKQYVDQNQQMLSDDSKIGVIGHSMFFRIYTTKDEFWKDREKQGHMPGQEMCINMRNCEFYPDTSNF